MLSLSGDAYIPFARSMMLPIRVNRRTWKLEPVSTLVTKTIDLIKCGAPRNNEHVWITEWLTKLNYEISKFDLGFPSGVWKLPCAANRETSSTLCEKSMRCLGEQASLINMVNRCLGELELVFPFNRNQIAAINWWKVELYLKLLLCSDI